MNDSSDRLETSKTGTYTFQRNTTPTQTTARKKLLLQRIGRSRFGASLVAIFAGVRRSRFGASLVSTTSSRRSGARATRASGWWIIIIIIIRIVILTVFVGGPILKTFSAASLGVWHDSHTEEPRRSILPATTSSPWTWMILEFITWAPMNHRAARAHHEHLFWGFHGSSEGFQPLLQGCYLCAVCFNLSPMSCIDWCWCKRSVWSLRRVRYPLYLTHTSVGWCGRGSIRRHSWCRWHCSWCCWNTGVHLGVAASLTWQHFSG